MSADTVRRAPPDAGSGFGKRQRDEVEQLLQQRTDRFKTAVPGELVGELLSHGVGALQGGPAAVTKDAYLDGHRLRIGRGRGRGRQGTADECLERGGLEGSFSTFDRLRRERAAEPASLEALVGRALAATTPAAADPESVTVEIGVLCYSGRAALERANAVRQQLADELARHGGLESIRPLLQELLDLVPLALAES